MQFSEFVCLLIMLSVCFAGCRTANQHRQSADKAALGIIGEYEEKALGGKSGFSIERPSSILRNKLIVEQGLPLSTNLFAGPVDMDVPAMPNPLPLSLNDALQVAARNSREYQSQKEEVFRAALQLDLARDEFRSSFSGLLSSAFESADDDVEKKESMTQRASAGLNRAFQTGASISSRLALDLVNLLTGDKSETLGLVADATISIPLLRGAGKSVAREPLTQAERDVIYAIWHLERFKRAFAVDVTSESLSLLRAIEEIKNIEANFERIKDTRKRAESLGDAGRLDNIQVDQARQDELRARNQLLSARMDLDAAFDALKLTLGLPVDAAIMMDPVELRAMAERISARLEAGEDVFEKSREEDLILLALENRLDLKTAVMRLEDAKRAVDVARDNLLANVRINAGASVGQTDNDAEGSSSATKVDYSGLLEVDLPWEKTSERTEYRNSLIDLEQAKRNVEEKEDEVKSSIRDALRRRREALEAYRIQVQARELAEKRVKSINLFQEAGRATIRDSLEAEEALLSAQNAALQALVSCQITALQLLKDLEELEVGEDLLIKDKVDPGGAGLESESEQADGN